MTKLRVNSFSISLDGYGAGPEQDLENPLGVGGEALHDWLSRRARSARCSARRAARPGSTTTSRRAASSNLGAWILGRNMFGPVRGPWPDESWKGWWGDSPPYHVPVFVLTHHARAPLDDGGRHDVFHFVTDGIERRACARQRGGRRQGHPGRRRRRDDPAISCRRADRRDASRGFAGAARRAARACSPGSICRSSAMRARGRCRRKTPRIMC